MLGAVVRVSGQRFAGCGVVGLLSCSLPRSPLPLEVARAPLPHCTVGGGVGWGARICWGGRPAALSPVPSPAPIAWADGARPSPPSLLVRGPGLRRWRVPPAVAPVGEGVAQRPGEPVVGIRIRDAEHCPPLQESWPRRLPVGPRCPNHCPEDPLVVLRGRPTPRGLLPVPPVPPEDHGIEGRFLIPLVVPEQAQLSHPYTSTSRSRASALRGSGTVSQSRSQGRSPSAPLAGPPCGPCARGARPRPAPRPPSLQPSALAPPSARGGAAGAGVGGVEGG